LENRNSFLKKVQILLLNFVPRKFATRLSDVMADRLVAPPNTEEEEFLTDVDESLPTPQDDTPTRRRRSIQEGLPRRRSEDEEAEKDARRPQLCVSANGYNNKTDNSDANIDASKDAPMQQEWRVAVRRKKELSAQKRKKEKMRSHKHVQKGELNSCSNQSGIVENETAYVIVNAGAYVSAYTTANAGAYVTAYTSVNASAYTA
jgi:hypothetical protein